VVDTCSITNRGAKPWHERNEWIDLGSLEWSRRVDGLMGGRRGRVQEDHELKFSARTEITRFRSKLRGKKEGNFVTAERTT